MRLNLKTTMATAAILAGSVAATPALAGDANGYGVSSSAVANDFFRFVSTGAAYRMNADGSGNYTISGDTPPVLFNGCPGRLLNNPNELCLASPAGTANPSYDLVASNNSASLRTGPGSPTNTSGVVTATSYADLANGKLGAAVAADFGYSGIAAAVYNDVLNFTIAGADASTISEIGVTFSIDGILQNSGNAFSVASMTGDLRFGSAFANVGYQAAGTLSESRTHGGWVSGSWGAGSGPGLSTFTGIYALTGAAQMLSIRSALTASASSVATSDYSNTSAFTFTLPSTVTYSSNSGTFLSALAPPPGGVPEPASWAMLITGFGAIGTTMRRRRKYLTA